MESLLNRRNQAYKSGFTLIELLIVIAIILILIAIALPNFLEAQMRAKIAKAKSEMRSLGIAMESYLIQYNMFPPDHDPDSLTGANGLFYLTTPIQFIGSVPADPFNEPGSGLQTSEASYEMASTGRSAFPAPAPPPSAPKINAFALHSHGPARRDTFSGNDSWPCGGPIGNPCVGGMGWLDYSPTNGTRSVGQLMQLGGEFTSGLYCVDNWRIVKGYHPVPCPGQ